jgi:lipid-binding SYLF domain-containing protein
MRGAIGLIATASLCVLAGCAHAPTQPGARADLINASRKTLERLEAKDPTLRPVVDNAAGYIVFPSVGEGGFLIGAGSGTGVLFENGQPIHFAELRHVSAGALVGGQRYAQVVVIKDPAALQAFKSGRFNFGAQATAVIVRTGAASRAAFDKGVAVFAEEKSGAMVNASLTGTRIRLTL